MKVSGGLRDNKSHPEPAADVESSCQFDVGLGNLTQGGFID